MTVDGSVAKCEDIGTIDRTTILKYGYQNTDNGI